MIYKAKNKQKHKNMINMISTTTLIVALVTYILVVLYLILLNSNSGMNIGLGGLIIYMIPILITFIIGIIIVAKRANAQPFLSVIIYIILTIGFLFATVAIKGVVIKAVITTYAIAGRTMDKTMIKKGERLYNNLYYDNTGYAIYYYNGELREINVFENNKTSSKIISTVANLDLNVVERDYIKVYEINKKYTFLLEKSAVNSFNEWIIYVENVGYMRWLGGWERHDIIFVVKCIIRSNEYIILDEDIHSKFFENERNENDE